MLTSIILLVFSSVVLCSGHCQLSMANLVFRCLVSSSDSVYVY